MRKRHRFNLLIWFTLVCVAALEIGVSFLPIPAGTRPILLLPAAMMVVLVACGYMRLLSAPDIARCFAVGGMFWLALLLGLTMADPLTRTIYTVTENVR